MKASIIKQMKNEEGAALIWALILFVIVVILSASAIVVARQDILETNLQNQRLKAYYMALSGVELGYAALMAPDSTPGPLYINRFNASKAQVTHEEIIKEGLETVGKVQIAIDWVTVDGKAWVQISAVGHLEGSSVTATSVMRIDPSNHANIVSEKIGH